MDKHNQMKYLFHLILTNELILLAESCGVTLFWTQQNKILPILDQLA